MVKRQYEFSKGERKKEILEAEQDCLGAISYASSWLNSSCVIGLLATALPYSGAGSRLFVMA